MAGTILSFTSELDTPDWLELQTSWLLAYQDGVMYLPIATLAFCGATGKTPIVMNMLF